MYDDLRSYRMRDGWLIDWKLSRCLRIDEEVFKKRPFSFADETCDGHVLGGLLR